MITNETELIENLRKRADLYDKANDYAEIRNNLMFEVRKIEKKIDALKAEADIINRDVEDYSLKTFNLFTEALK